MRKLHRGRARAANPRSILFHILWLFSSMSRSSCFSLENVLASDASYANSFLTSRTTLDRDMCDELDRIISTHRCGFCLPPEVITAKSRSLAQLPRCRTIALLYGHLLWDICNGAPSKLFVNRLRDLLDGASAAWRCTRHRRTPRQVHLYLCLFANVVAIGGLRLCCTSGARLRARANRRMLAFHSRIRFALGQRGVAHDINTCETLLEFLSLQITLCDQIASPKQCIYKLVMEKKTYIGRCAWLRPSSMFGVGWDVVLCMRIGRHVFIPVSVEGDT